MFNVGDYVTTKECYKFKPEEVGKIVFINKRLRQPYLVVFEHRTDLHNGNGAGGYPPSEDRNLWWLEDEELIYYNTTPLQYEEMM